jgi:hypothetical protein
MSRRPTRHCTIKPVFKASSLDRSILLSRSQLLALLPTRNQRPIALNLEVLGTETSLSESASLLEVYSGSDSFCGSTDESSDPTKWQFIDVYRSTCRCFTNDPIPDPSRSLLPWWTVDRVRSMLRQSRTSARCSDSKLVIRTTPVLGHRTIRTPRTTRLRATTGRRTPLSKLDRFRRIRSMTWSPSRTSIPRPAAGTWLGGVIPNGRLYRCTRPKSVSLRSRPTRSSSESTIIRRRSLMRGGDR